MDAIDGWSAHISRVFRLSTTPILPSMLLHSDLLCQSHEALDTTDPIAMQLENMEALKLRHWTVTGQLCPMQVKQCTSITEAYPQPSNKYTTPKIVYVFDSSMANTKCKGDHRTQ